MRAVPRDPPPPPIKGGGRIPTAVGELTLSFARTVGLTARPLVTVAGRLGLSCEESIDLEEGISALGCAELALAVKALSAGANVGSV